jgi:hypothetical protein
MTVSSELNRKEYAGNGATVAFATSPVVFFDEADLQVYVVVDATGVATLKTISTHYTVSGGDGSTGTVTMLTAPATGETLVIVRNLEMVQEVDLVNNDASDAEVIEDALDKLTMMAQQNSARLDRSFVLPDSDTSGASTEIPAPEASTVIGWNSAGDALENIPDLVPSAEAAAAAAVSAAAALASEVAAEAAQVAAEAAAAAAAVGNLTVDEFTGDGSDTTFTLSVTPSSETNTQVYLSGVYQEKSEYSVSGTTLTFGTAPANGVSIEVVIGGVQDIGVPSDGTVTDAKLSDTLSTLIGGLLNVPGRLTLTTAVPVTSSDVTGATTVYFTPYKGNTVPLYDGSAWQLHTFSELSQATTDATKSPAAVANSSNYDVFVWNDNGTLRATRGPAWSSATARGTGAGTTELELVGGRYVNKIAITNGPAAQRGLYVGSIRSNASAQINDSVLLRHVWNNYNRVGRHLQVVDGTNSWNYTLSTFQQANANAANQFEVLIGLSEDPVRVDVVGVAGNPSSTVAVGVGVGVDSTSVNSAQIRGSIIVATGFTSLSAVYRGYPGIGRHTLAWLEASGAAGTTAWYGDNGGAEFQSGMVGEVLA